MVHLSCAHIKEKILYGMNPQCLVDVDLDNSDDCLSGQSWIQSTMLTGGRSLFPGQSKNGKQNQLELGNVAQRVNSITPLHDF
jgi:hypothetical protein